MKNYFLALNFLMLLCSKGQKITGAQFKCLGPDFLPTQNIGFVNACWADENDRKIVYAGSLYGGLFKGIKSTSENSYTWKNITDNYESPGTGIAAIEVVPNTEGKVIYIGTQMGGNGRIYNYGQGILKTIDGGEHWKKVGPKISVTDNKIVDYLKMNPEFPEVMYARIGNDDYYTEDGWKTWSAIHPPIKNKDQYLHIADIEWKPGTKNFFYLSTRSENNEKAEFFCSSDGGRSWKDMKHGLVASNIQMDVIRKKGMEELIFIAYAEQGAFLQFYDGKIWSQNKNAVGIFNGNGYWNMEFEVNEEDTSIIYLSMTQLAKSTNGGKSFQIISDYFGVNTHADIRDLKILQSSIGGKNDLVMIANDGGVSISLPGAENTKTWQNINGKGLSIAQFWGISTCESRPGLIIGGGQDNGIYTYNNGNWSNQTSGIGDGYDAAISEINPDFAIAQGNSPSIAQTLNQGKNWRLIAYPPGPCNNFRRPMWMDKKNNKLWLGHHQLFMKDNSNGKLDAKWKQKTFFPDLKQKNGMLFNQQINCFAINGKNSETCLLVFSGVLWGNDSLKGKLFFTKNLNEENPDWKDITRYAPNVNWRELSDIIADPNDENIFYSIWQDIYSGFNSEIMKMEIPENADTILFTKINYNLPNYPCNKICIEYSSAGNIYLATDTGIYFTNYSLLDKNEWLRFEGESSKLPFAVISDLEINKSENKIYIATYGRGLWCASLAETGREKTISIKKDEEWNEPKRIDGKLIVGRGKILKINHQIFISSKSVIELKKNAKIILKDETILKDNNGSIFQINKIKKGKGASIKIK